MRMLKIVLIGSILLGLVGGAASVGRAFPTIGYTNARAAHKADKDCFYEGSYAAIWNTCDDSAHSRKVLLALPQTFTESQSVFSGTAVDKGSGSGTLPTCRAMVVANDNHLISQSVLTIIPLGGTNLVAMDVGNGSYSHHFECDIFGGRYGMSEGDRF